MGLLDKFFNYVDDYVESGRANQLMEKVQKIQEKELKRQEKIRLSHSGLNGLRCTKDQGSPEKLGDFFKLSGSLTNIGMSVYDSVTLLAKFYDKDGHVVDKSVCHAVISINGTLKPGESVRVSAMSSAKNVKNAEFEISEFSEVG